MVPLPRSTRVPTDAFAGLFNNTTNSYKFLFFLAILEEIKVGGFLPAPEINLKQLGSQMLAIAWFPHTYFKLNFGAQDQVSKTLEEFNCQIQGVDIGFNSAGRSRLLLELQQRVTDHVILKYVSHRLIRVFFASELYGLQDHKVNRRIDELAREQFDEKIPIYCLNEITDCIKLHPLWIDYFKQNYTIVEAWARWEWLQYMQKKNSSVPALASKLLPPTERSSLARQTELWQRVISKTDVKCIYSGRTLEPGFSLDHFIPWSLVAHDQLWNLIPVDPIANSRKCDKLPSAKYLQQLTKAHAQALNLWKKTHAEPEWQKIVTEYTQDLRFQSEDDLLDEPKLSANLSENLGLLLELGKRQGFESDWEYR